jgi:hypothetical protein
MNPTHTRAARTTSPNTIPIIHFHTFFMICFSFLWCAHGDRIFSGYWAAKTHLTLPLLFLYPWISQ